MRWRSLAFLAVAALASAGWAAEPSRETQVAFDAHVRGVEARLDSLLRDNRNAFLWANTPERRARLRTGSAICEPRIGKGYREVPGGLIHDWVGAVFIPGATVAGVLDALQDYDNHKNAYGPNVIDSRRIEKRGNDYRVRLRLLERKLTVTVVLDSDYDVRYTPLEGADWRSVSRSTRIVEIANPGRPDEREKTPRENRGYLWRLNSYWLFRELDGGVYVECEAVSLSRGVPAEALLGRIVRDMPKGFLENTLASTRKLVLARSVRPGR